MNGYNPFSLEGKTVLVTGASSGIGRATAVECSRMGAKVVLTARNKERLKETLSLMTGEGHIIIPQDLTQTDGLERLASECPALDGAVFSAGIMKLTPILALSEDKIQAMQQINLYAPVLLLKQLVKKKKLNNPSSVVFVSSAAGVYRVSMANAIYAGTKSALDAYMRTAALELASRGIRCNSVNPGLVETSLISSLSDDEKNKEMQNYPLHRFAQPADVALGIVYLLSDASSFVTGTALKIDGGMTLS